MKKSIILAIIILGITVSLPAFAATQAPVADAVKIACVSGAVSVRERKLSQSFEKYTTSLTTAYKDRGSDLANSYLTASSSVAKSNVKKAWDKFRNTSKTASKTWRTEKNTAWSEYKNAVKVCKAPSGVSDSGYSGSEPSL